MKKKKSKWYRIGDETRRLTAFEIYKYPKAELVTCSECLFELNTGEAAPDGIQHTCDDYYD